MKEKILEENKIFKYIVILVVLLIPFMYSFFYLKAYWNPYGEGNIDNLPVAIINEDKGNRGEQLIDSIKESNKLKLTVISEDKALEGLNNGKYYAIINIPKDFTKSIESAKEENKKHATITYSPNQKSNYLSSQIINSVVTAVEKNLDNQINSTIVDSLEETTEAVPEKLQTINSGFKDLQDGTNQLQMGSATLKDGTTELKNSYQQFSKGIEQINNGAQELSNATNEFNALNNSLIELTTGVNELKNGSDTLNTGITNYTAGVNTTLDYTKNLVDLIKATICPKVANNIATEYEIQMCQIATGLSTPSPSTGNTDTLTYLKASSQTLVNGANTLNGGLTTLNTNVTNLSSVSEKLNNLKAGIDTLATGTNTLLISSNQVQNGITALDNGASSLNTGIVTLNSSVGNASLELEDNINKTKEELKKVNGLGEYAKEPVNVETKEVNKIESYGTAFAPLFISIALWVGCLMLFIILYYDKKERFGILSNTDTRRVKRTLCYHVLASISGLLLGILLQLLLDFEITSYFLYYISIILIANCFLTIISFLISNFNDVGKFIALIVLVLQLAASGGTFPIETVTKGFRFLNPLLPMTYTIKLLKESLVTIESSLLSKNLIIILSITIILFIINITLDIVKQKREN